MDDQVQEQAVETAEEQTAEVESPTTQAEQTPVGEAETEQVEAETESESSESEDETVPEMDDTQAKAFQKQRQEIKRLQEELKAKQGTESMLSQFTKVPPGQNVDPRFYVDSQLDLYKTLNTFPQLDKGSDQYDEALDERVTGKWVLARMTGNPASMLEVAKTVIKTTQKQIAKEVRKQTEEVAKDIKESISLKEKSSAVAPTKSSGVRTTAADLDALRVRTRQGDTLAFIERMKRAEGR